MTSFKIIRGPISLILLTMIPIGIWSMMQPITTRFKDSATTLLSIGQLSGLIGMLLFTLSIILSARIKIIENYFSGLHKIYLNHHRIGGIAFIALLAHPLALTLQIAIYSIHEAALFLVPNLSQYAVFLGIVALLLMMILMVTTFHYRPPYHIWKYTHRFLGPVFIIAFLHVLYISSDTSRSIILKGYIIVLAAIAILGVLYRSILPMLLVKRHDCIVDTVTQLNDSITEITMKPIGKPFVYTAGQFIYTSFKDEFVSKEAHPFTMVSDPSQPNIAVAIKSLGDFTRTVKYVVPGSRVKIEGPFGKFTYPHFGNRQIWIAGGIGVTPFVSMARDLATKKSNYRIDLYYATRNESEAVYSDELKRLAEANHHFTFIPWFSDIQGMLTAETIEKTSTDLGRSDILLCGPPVMMSALTKQFRTQGIAKKHIHSESFSY